MSVIDDHLASASPEHRTILEHIRALIQETVPETEEVLSYGIPALNYKGKHLIHFESFKEHMSLFPGAMPPEILAKVADFTHSKGTIQFTVDHTIPDETIRDIILIRKAAIDEGGS